MSLAIDALILVIGIIIILVAAKKGLIRAIMGLVSSIVSFVVAYAFTPTVSAYISERYILERIAGNISETLKGWAFDTSTDMFNLDRLADPENSGFLSVLNRYIVGFDKIVDSLRGLVAVSENEVDAVAEKIAHPVSSLLSNVIAFILLFVGTSVALIIVTWLLDKMFKLPILSGVNKFFGLLFGIAEAVFVAYVLSMGVYHLVGTLGSVSPSIFGEDVIEKTVICRFFAEHNLISSVNELLSYIP